MFCTSAGKNPAEKLFLTLNALGRGFVEACKCEALISAKQPLLFRRNFPGLEIKKLIFSDGGGQGIKIPEFLFQV